MSFGLDGSVRFAYPAVLALLIALPLLGLLLRRWRGASAPATLRFAHLPLVTGGSRGWRVRLRRLPRLLRWLALALLIGALARPQSGSTQQIVRGEGIDITLALDISGSMASLDFQPDNRLTAAKSVITDFIAERPFDRIGLTVFASEAFVQSPLTIDHAVLGRLLQAIDLAPRLGLTDGTAIGMGIATAANMLKDSPATSRVVILLTDGVNNAGSIDPFTAAQAAEALGIRVYTIGAGRPGQVPFPDVNIFGEETITYRESDIDEETLQAIADRTGGLYFRAEDTAGLRAIYEAINELERSEVEIETYSRYEELARWLLLPALALLILEQLLNQTVLRRLP